MKRKDEYPDTDLDRAIDEIRNETIDPAVVDDAARRVWERVSREADAIAGDASDVDSIRRCDDFQRLIPAFLEGDLSDARAMLVEDHTRACIPCRRALNAARSRDAVPPPREVVTTRAGAWRSPFVWSAAATVLLVAILAVFSIIGIERGAPISVASVDGSLFQMAGDEPAPVAAGTVFDDGESIRTARDSGAILELADGSRVEMNERSEVRVTRRRSDVTVNLARGSIIVQAAARNTGHLYVRTEDCLVSVTGTVFSVNHGTRGSRVSVIEGEVRVDHGRELHVLLPGDQVTTDRSLGKVPIEQEIAWSRNLDQHLALLTALDEVRRELKETIGQTPLRHSTRLLDLAPEGTVIFVAFPNLSETLSEGHRLLREKVEASEPLRKWWQETMVESGAEVELADAMEKIRSFGEQLGDEIVLTLQSGPERGMRGPVFLADLKRPEEFRRLLAEELSRLDTGTGREPPMRIIENPFSASGINDTRESMLFWAQGDLLVVAPHLADLQSMASLAGTPGSSRFVGSAFHGELAETYGDGVGILFGADMETILGQNAASDAETLDKLGLMDLTHLIVERHDVGGTTETRATLGFHDARRGVAAWLAEPAPMGALDFISGDATAVAAFVVKTPSSLLDELFTRIGEIEEDFREELASFEREHNVDLVQDVAGPLGGEIALALDGPILPKPAWKLIMEVYDPAGFQNTVGWAVEEVNLIARDSGRPGLSLREEQVAGRTYHTLTAEQTGTSIHYTFVDGYILVGPQRGLLNRAIQHRRSGTSLPNSRPFTDLLPRDGRAHFSAVVYHDLGAVLDPFLRNSLAKSATVSPEQRAAIEALTAEAVPSLFYAYAERDRIVVGGSDRAGLLGTNLTSVFQLGSIMSLRNALEQSADGTGTVYDDREP